MKVKDVRQALPPHATARPHLPLLPQDQTARRDDSRGEWHNIARPQNILRQTEVKYEDDNLSVNCLTPTQEKTNEAKAPAGWRRGYAADCKSVKTGSIPVPASILFQCLERRAPLRGVLRLQYRLQFCSRCTPLACASFTKTASVSCRGELPSGQCRGMLALSDGKDL